ncbi:unnamed protein product [[Actinomadura] parvosata subsp. kistnae]|uniref:Uncharacterized protein n=1 Tax=[Actinomadura] parvosata subsp. kistnae TaxID=1909395 RepID=A0A1V0A1D1_9ACTN|nr:hypothetical protein BKM31_23410 [Nonomuraea sp. ATCC 55076]SPL89895.1 unnamed protein product [Actinomadura parvosata subsp. kistnae]
MRALKSTMAPGHGVRFTETSTWSDGLDTLQAYTNRGTLQFGKKGLAAYDIRSTSYRDAKDRAISIGKSTYYSGEYVADYLPKGKTWFRLDGGGAMPYLYGQVLNPAEPATLSALLAKGTRAGNKVTGRITFKSLAQVSPWFSGSDLKAWAADTEVSYTLTLTSAGLVGTLSSSFRAKGAKDEYATFEGDIISVETRYTGWGGKVSIKAPDPSTVTGKSSS